MVISNGDGTRGFLMLIHVAFHFFEFDTAVVEAVDFHINLFSY